MKRIIIFTNLFLFAGIASYAQQCYTYFEGVDFKANSTYQKSDVLVADQTGAIWFNLIEATTAIGNNGLVKIKDNTWSEFNTDNSEMPGNKVNAIAFDSKKNTWVATDKGLAMFDGSSTSGWNVYKIAEGLPEENVTALTIDSKDTIWIGFSSGKLYKVINGTISKAAEVTGQIINCLFADKDDNIWLGLNATNGTKKGIASYIKGQISMVNCPNSITSFAQISNGSIYASSLVGIYTNASGVWLNDFPSSSFYKVSADKNDVIWVSSNDTLYSISYGKIRAYSVLNSGIPATGSVVLTKTPVIEDGFGKNWFIYYKSSKTAIASFAASVNTIDLINDTLINFCSGSELTLDAGNGFKTYYWNNGLTLQSIKSNIDFYYNVAVADQNNCFYYDTVHTKMQVPYTSERLCLVTVNPEDSTNLVIWQRTSNKGTKSYNIYKETGNAGEFAFLGNIPATELSVFVDEASEPEKQSNRYKIATVDSCDNESEKSPEHKTLHLTINLGIEGKFNLIWENYEGINFTQYKIYRGTSPDNMEQIGVSPSNNTSYTDDPAPGTYYYQLAIVLPEICAPAILLKASAGPYSEAVSNMEKKLRSTGSYISTANTLGVSIYPTSFNEKIIINSQKVSYYNIKAELVNLNGQVIFETQIKEINGQYELVIPSLPKGLYLCRLMGDNLYFISKLVRE